MRRAHRLHGFSVLELLCVVSLAIILAGMAVPLGSQALDDAQVAAAARYLAGRFYWARMEAVKRTSYTGYRFVQQGADYVFGAYVDGNRNGILSRDIASGIDRTLGAMDRLANHFPRASFSILPGVTPIEPGDVLSPGSDPIRFGRASLVSFSPDGSGTAGTVYVGGRRSQLAVRVLGVTGRIRVLRFDFAMRRWVDP